MSLGNQTQHIALKHKGEKMNQFLWKMAGHAHPPPAPVMTGPTMTQIGNGRQILQSFKAAKTLSWPSSPPFFFPNKLQPPALGSLLHFKEQKEMGMQGPTGTCIIRR